jgi:hypothetical protein
VQIKIDFGCTWFEKPSVYFSGEIMQAFRYKCGIGEWLWNEDTNLEVARYRNYLEIRHYKMSL